MKRNSSAFLIPDNSDSGYYQLCHLWYHFVSQAKHLIVSAFRYKTVLIKFPALHPTHLFNILQLTHRNAQNWALYCFPKSLQAVTNYHMCSHHSYRDTETLNTSCHFYRSHRSTSATPIYQIKTKETPLTPELDLAYKTLCLAVVNDGLLS